MGERDTPIEVAVTQAAERATESAPAPAPVPVPVSSEVTQRIDPPQLCPRCQGRKSEACGLCMGVGYLLEAP